MMSSNDIYLEKVLGAEQRVLEAMQDGVFLMNREGAYLWANTAFERLLRSQPGGVLPDPAGLDCRDEYGRSLSGFLSPARLVFSGERRGTRQRMQIVRAGESALWLDTVYSALPGPEGNGPAQLVLGVARDISESIEREREMVETVRGLRDYVTSLGGDPTAQLRYPGVAQERPEGGGEAGAPSSLRLDDNLARMERDAIIRALEAADWQRNKAARLMGISRSRLYRRMEALGIDPNVHD